MHFWQQLPRHVVVYIPAMYSLDAHMYSLLEHIYLSRSVNNIALSNSIVNKPNTNIITDTSISTFNLAPLPPSSSSTLFENNLSRLNTIAMLIPVWLKKTFQFVHQQPHWNLIYSDSSLFSSSLSTTTSKSSKLLYENNCNIGQIKVKEAVRWCFRIKFKIDFIIMLKVRFFMLNLFLDFNIYI